MKCYNCYNPQLDTKAEACEHCDALTNPPSVKYFHVHPLRFLLLYVITLGLFPLYYIYKNWVAIKEAERTRIRPFWRAWFHVLFCISLFVRIYGDAKTRGYKSRLSASRLVIFYIVAGLIWSISENMRLHLANIVSDNALTYLSIIMKALSFLTSLLPLLLIQPTIKFCNAQAGTDHSKN